MEKPLTTLIQRYLDDHQGTSEEDLISAIALLAGNGDHHHPPGSCTETSDLADRLCGARSLVEYAMAALHR